MQARKLNAWAEPAREVRNHSLDSTRWYAFSPRAGDVVIGTWAKTGTTWVQQILGQFLFDASENVPVFDLAPWVEHCANPMSEMFGMLEQQPHRRFMKTHLPVDALVFYPQVRYIYVARDGRDVFWSWYHHHSNLTPLVYDVMKEAPGSAGPPLTPPDCSPREYFRRWLERDGFPLWPFWSHVQSWWDIRDRPNVLLLHFNELKRDLPRAMRRIAAFVEYPVNEAKWDRMVEHCRFDYMKANASSLSHYIDDAFVGGASTFINRGVGGGWRDVLTADDVADYEAQAAANLTPECAHWLATGEMAGREG